MNEVMMAGRIGKEPTLNMTKSGKSVCKVSIAVYAGKDSNGNSVSEWYVWECWNYLADRIAKAKVGDTVIFRGNAKIEKFKAQDGRDIERVIFQAREVFIEPKKSMNDGLVPQKEVFDDTIFTEDDVPF